MPNDSPKTSRATAVPQRLYTGPSPADLACIPNDLIFLYAAALLALPHGPQLFLREA